VHLSTVQAKEYVDVINLTESCEVGPGSQTIQKYKNKNKWNKRRNK
jgi:hypothetical protein